MATDDALTPLFPLPPQREPQPESAAEWEPACIDRQQADAALSRAEQVAAIADPRVFSGLDAASRARWWQEWEALLEQQAAALAAFQALLAAAQPESAAVLVALARLRRASTALISHWRQRYIDRS